VPVITQNGATWDAAGGISAGAALLDRIARGLRVRVRQQWWSLCASIQTPRGRRRTYVERGLPPPRTGQLEAGSNPGSTSAASP
jgi:hypothetical protein